METASSYQYDVIETLPSTVGDFAVAAYKAREQSSGDTLGRVVMLRRLPSEIEADSLRGASAQYASLPIHPNILTHFGLADVAGSEMPAGTYVATEWARGITLRERIRRVAPFSTAVCLDIAIAITQVLMRAKAHGVDHGYLRPEHVLLTPEGQVKVADFCLGRAIRRALGEAVPEETAVYSVARILYEMATGIAPAAEPEPLLARSASPAIPLTLHGIIQKATVSQASQVYANLGALLADLQAARQDARAGKPLNWNPLAAPAAAQSHPVGTLSGAADEIIREEHTMARPGTSKTDRDRYARDDEDEYYDDEPSRAATVFKRVILALIVLVVVGGVFALAYFAMLVGNVPSDITIPDLVGKQYKDAQSIANAQHFTLVEASHDYSNNWPQGAIYQQTPMAGRSIKAGKPVSVWVSDGPQLLAVPDVSQMTLAKAQGVVQDSGLPVGSIDNEYDNTVPKGIVMSQQPAAGSQVSRVTAINLTVSKGPPPPPAPTGLSATSTIPGEIDVSWDDVPIAATYNVYRDGSKVASALPQTTYSDLGLDDNSTHTYTVSAVDSNGESQQSQAVTATTAPGDSSQPTAAPEASPTTGTGASAQSAGTSSGTPKQRQFEIKFAVPQSGGQHNVQIEVQDTTGTNVVYDEDRDAGQVVDENFTAFGNKVVFRIFLDGKLIKQETK
jgi:hypothetical protein